MPLELQSPAFEEGQTIPKRYTGDGENVSPPLNWDFTDGQAQEFALIVDDPDAPRPEPWVHWVLHGIPSHVTRLPEDLPHDDALKDPPGAQQGLNSWGRGNVGYRGPEPPPGHGVHRYQFKLYALDTPLNLAGGIDKDALLQAMEGHIIASAQLTGTYER